MNSAAPVQVNGRARNVLFVSVARQTATHRWALPIGRTDAAAARFLAYETVLKVVRAHAGRAPCQRCRSSFAAIGMPGRFDCLFDSSAELIDAMFAERLTSERRL